MNFFLKTVLPILAGVALWNLMPGMTAKLIALGVAAVIIAVPILRGKYLAHQETRGRMIALMLTVALISASTLPAPAQSRAWAPEGESMAQVQFVCGFWCKVAWGIGGSAVWDGIKAGVSWWFDNVWDTTFPAGCIAEGTCL